MEIRGVCYDVGRELLGENWRPDFDPRLVHRELQIIRNDLHCTAVRICGKDSERLTAAAEDALQQGLDVWLSPELYDRTAQETLDHIVAAAAEAEQIRERWPGRVVLSIGSELTLFMKGILRGDDVLERIGNPARLALVMLKLRYLGTHNKPLGDYLARAAQEVRRVFHGPLTYASVPAERVDWDLFDIISVDYYRARQNRADYGERLQPYLAHRKPVVVTEVGCCTYQGAENKGGRAFMIVDRKHPDRLKPGYLRDESVQAREDVDMLTALDQAGVQGAFVYTFTMPTMRHSDDPLRDFDKASYSLVKTLVGGAAASAYPDMAWEPKEAFHAVAEFYRGGP